MNIDNNKSQSDIFLDRCRQVESRKEEDAAWAELIHHLSGASDAEISSLWIREILLEWPYSSQYYAGWIDKILNIAGTVLTISTCCMLLKELGSAEVSPTLALASPQVTKPGVLESCWSIIQHFLLSSTGSKTETGASRSQSNDWETLTKLILRIPQLIANACNACQVRLPKLATPSHFYPRLVDASFSQPSSSTTGAMQERRKSNVYRTALLHSLLSSHRGDQVAIGLASHHPLDDAIVQEQWTSFELTDLISSLLLHIVSSGEEKTSLDTHLVMHSCVALLKSASLEEQEAFVQHVTLSTLPSKNTRNLRLCPLIVHLVKKCGILRSSLVELAENWSQWTFCQEIGADQQRYVSELIVLGLDELASDTRKNTTSNSNNERDQEFLDSDPLILTLLQGVSHRLESSVSPIRIDGMRIAVCIAKQMNQELHFEELEEYEKKQLVVDPTNGKGEASKQDSNEKITITKVSIAEDAAVPLKNTRKATPRKQVDPDADYDSDAIDSDVEDHGSLCLGSDDDDDSTLYDEQLIPYDLDDPESDLVETKSPMHLLEALNLLRTGENDEHAYSHHETAIKALPSLIRKQPDDLQDVAVSIFLQLLRMEDKFGIPNFLKYRHESLVALTVEQPTSVGSTAIQEIFKDSALLDRLSCLGVLQEAAYELSGSKKFDEQQASKSRKLGDPKESDSSSMSYGQKMTSFKAGDSHHIVRLRGRTRYKRSPRVQQQYTIENRFSAVAPIWFYALLGTFLKEKHHESMWSGSNGSQLVASIFKTLAIMVEFAGLTVGPILGKDLFELVWSFRDADVTEVRTAVLISVVTAFSVLPEHILLSTLQQYGDSFPTSIKKISRVDPDETCRQLALTVSESISGMYGDESSQIF